MTKAKSKPAPKVEPTTTKPETAMTKMEAVRRAIAAGVDKPTAAEAYIKEQFGLEVSAQMFSSYKTSMGKSKGVASGSKKSATKAVDNASVSLARDVKTLVDKYGVANVKSMAEVFAG